jgi:hypothetical protein
VFVRGVVDEIIEGVFVERHYFVTLPLDRIFLEINAAVS